MLDIPLFESPTTSSLPSYHIENTHSFSYNQQSNQALSISSSNSELFYVQLFREIFATLSVDHNKYQVEKDDAQIEEDMDDIDFPLIPPVRTYKVTGRIGKITRGELAISFEEDIDDTDFPLIPPVRTYKVTGRIGKITRGKLAISYEE